MDEREILLFVHCKARQLTNHHLPGYFALILRYDCMGRVKYGTNESIIGSKGGDGQAVLERSTNP